MLRRLFAPPAANVATVGLVALLSLAAASPASAQCRLALALGLDVSASVDLTEYGLQLNGLAAALTAPSVRQALLSDPGAPVALAIYEWSGWADQRLLVDWVEIVDTSALEGVIAQLASVQRIPMDDSTALGAALLYGAGLLARRPECARWVIDVSGDGKNNDGVEPDMLGAEPALDGITVNGLVIGADATRSDDLRAVQIGDLSRYFEANVIRGPGAFVQIALGFRDYETAMTRKLLREIEGFVLGDVGVSR